MKDNGLTEKDMVISLSLGFGIFFYANGTKYEGYWTENRKEGNALFTNDKG